LEQQRIETLPHTTNRRSFLTAGGATIGGLAAYRAELGAFAQGTPTAGGALVFPNDPQYANLAHGINLRFVGSPAYVALCSTTTQVQQAVQDALDKGLRITVRSGGHCYENFAVGNDGGVIVDMSPMRGVTRDESGRYVIDAGAQLLDVYTTLDQQYGVTLPGGSCATVGAGGHITGGGYGMLSRLYGLTVDYLDAVELVYVTADGRAETIVASQDSTDPDEQDLLWGHTGAGGGNYGIVTRFLMKDLPPAPTEAHIFFHRFDWTTLDQASFRRLMQNYGNFMAENSGVDSPFKGLFPGLAIPQVGGHIGLFGSYVGDQPELLEQYAAAVEDGLPDPVAGVASPVPHHMVPQSSDFSSSPWLQATKNSSGGNDPQRAKYKSAYMIEPFPDEQIDVLWEFFMHPSNPNPQAVLGIDGYGCQINAVDSAATAVVQRSSILKLQYQTYWTDPADDDANLEWIRSFYTAMYGEQGPMPDATMDGCYVNYPDADLIDWPTLYYKENYARLQKVKARWDPLNIFNYEQSIRLPGEGGTATPAG
jgi:FAD/FMN-containing dehydrogenase